jgi:tRNA (guanine10-N2)-methyltransferase
VGKHGKHTMIWDNFDQYGFEQPVGLVRYDAHHPPLRPGLEELFDCIVCDPPYGVRAGGRKSGGRKPKELQR